MNLADALRLGESPRLALVGAGGKTTALFRLAHDLCGEMTPNNIFPRTVIVSASTHLATAQLAQADHHFIVESMDQLDRLFTSLPSGVVLLIGPPEENERMSSLGLPMLEQVARLAGERGWPVLLEADGARRKPFKAPAAHEPVIPDWVDTVVVVAGLSVLGRPLISDWVHRPERVTALSGLAAGETVTLEAMQRVLVDSEGGLKGVQAGARRVALLNQADTPELQAAGYCLAERLLGAYHAVVITSLTPQVSMHRDEPSASFAESAFGVFAVHEPVAAVILAAGASLRMGELKQTLLWHGEALVRHVARVALLAGLKPVVVVTGYSAAQVEAALDGLEVLCIHNPHWAAGQSTSLVAGMRLLPPETAAAVFMLADQPQVSPPLVRSLVGLHAVTLAPLVAPLVDGQRANPVLFDRVTFPALLSLTGDTGGRALFSRYPVAWLPWMDTSITFDVDTPTDYQRLLAL